LKKQLKKSAIIVGILWGFFMLVYMEYVTPYLSRGEIDVRWWNILIWVIFGMFFGITMYGISKSKLQKHF